MRKFTLLFAVLLSLVGVTKALAQESLTIYNDADYSSDYVPFDGYNADAVQHDQFIIPAAQLTAMEGTNIKSMTFYYKKNESSGTNVGNWIVSLGTTEATTLTGLDSSTSLSQVFSGAITPDTEAKTITITFDNDYLYSGGNLLVDFNHPEASGYKKFTFWCVYVTPAPAYATGTTRSYLPKTTFTYEEASQASGAAFTVKDGSTKLTSPYAYSFGLATAGTTKEFTLSNPGTEATPISINTTSANGFTAVVEDNATSIPAGGEVTLTITMPEATASGSIVVTPTGDGLSAFTLNVSGTVRDANKVYESGFTALPTDWTTTGSWYYSEANGAYTTVWYLTSNARLVTPKLTIAEGEKFIVEAMGYSTSNTSYQHLQMQYSADGSTWTNFDDEPSLDPSNWQTFEFTGVPAGTYYIAINASQADIRMFYGGELPQEPKMVVTQPASLDFGVITEATAKTFTIANTGKATLKGISVTSSNNSIFSITGAPTSLAAGASATMTITMAATTTGAQNSDITVSATDMEDVEFTVTGVVLPEGLATEEFNGTTIPANWTSSGSWTFATDGYAVGTSSSAYLYTPKLKFTEGDMVVITMAPSDTYSGDYMTINGSSDNGETYTAYTKKIEVPQGKDVYATYVVTDIPTTVNKIRFTGYYVSVDKIAGLTYAPVLSVTKAAEAVVSGSTYDFGESAADADVTYNFANTGAGTIDITAVGITGEGAAAYSTNWAEPTTAPFDLVISRTYNAEREGASVAIVTVTTSEGEFVINVTGTDKAANAPELAVTPDEGAAFGVVTEAAEKTYTVTNAGTGTLTVNIASNDAKFTVSAAQLTDIAAGDSKTFKVIFTPVAETYGTFNANITVTPTYDEEAAVVIAASAKVKDPEMWSEDFSGNAVPTGWNAGANWSIADGVAKATYKYGTTNYLTTPTLTVADASDELTFGYTATSNYVSVNIQMSKDGGAFSNYSTISNLNNGDNGTYTITGLEAGEYQFRFANDDYQLDNFEGFKLNLPDHIASITASTIPASNAYNITMKATQSFDATVTVAELRGVNEEVTAKLYMGETVIGQTTETVEASTSKVITITCTPTEAATEGVEMHIEVEWAGTKMTTEPTTRYVAEFVALALNESSTDDIEAGTYDRITVTRSYVQGWNTIVLPFAVNDLSVFGTGAKVYKYTGYDAEKEAVNFSSDTQILPATPYVLYLPEAVSPVITVENATINSMWVGSSNIAQTYSAWIFQGTYAPIAAGGFGNNDYGVTQSGEIKKAGSGASIKGFRAYFTPNESYSPEQNSQAPTVKAIVFTDLTTGVKVVRTMDAEMEGLFDLGGRKVNAARKGIFIQNGKKMVIR